MWDLAELGVSCGSYLPYLILSGVDHQLIYIDLICVVPIKLKYASLENLYDTLLAADVDLEPTNVLYRLLQML